MSTHTIAETVKEFQPWGMWYRNVRIFKTGNQFSIFGNIHLTIDAAKQAVDNAYLSLQKSIR